MFKLDITCPRCGGNDWEYFEKHYEGDWTPRFWKCVSPNCPGEMTMLAGELRKLAYCQYIPYGAKEPEDYLADEESRLCWDGDE